MSSFYDEVKGSNAGEVAQKIIEKIKILSVRTPTAAYDYSGSLDKIKQESLVSIYVAIAKAMQEGATVAQKVKDKENEITTLNLKISDLNVIINSNTVKTEENRTE